MRGTLAVFLLAHALYLGTASGWPFKAPDEFEVYFQSESLVDRGELAVGQLEGKAAFFGKRSTTNGKLYAPYGPLVAFCVVPWHIFARAVTGEHDPIARAGLTWLAGATAGALAAAGLARRLRA